MRRIAVALVVTVAVVVLLFSYRTSLSGSRVGTAGGAGGGTRPGVVRSVAPSGPASPGGSASPAAGTETVNGTVVFNGYGPVQVRAEIAGNRITDVTALQTPQDGRSQQINGYATPLLRQEVLAAQSAQVDAVSGATATSDAYRQSLQAALDAAHFGS